MLIQYDFRISIHDDYKDNKVAEIKGLENCKRLVHLSLKHNRISEISGLDHLPLKYLSLVSGKLFTWAVAFHMSRVSPDLTETKTRIELQ